MYPEIGRSYSAVTTDETGEIFLPTLALICSVDFSHTFFPLHLQ